MNSSYKYAFLGAIALCIVIVAVSTLNHRPTSSDPVAEPSSSSPTATAAQPPYRVDPADLFEAAQTPALSLEDRVNQRLLAAQQNSDVLVPGPVDIAAGRPKSPVKMVGNLPATEVAPQIRTFGAPPPSLSKTTKSLVQSLPTQETSASAAAKPVAPNKPRPRQYRIMPRDTFSNLAVRHYGHEKYWQAFARANPTVNPRKLRVGQIIKLPDPKLVAEAERESVPAPPAGTTIHVVRAGESLWTISSRRYDSVRHWRVIFNANRDVIGSDPDRLTVGQKLKIPPAIVVGNTSGR